LKEGFYRQLRDREWIFNRAEEQLIFLVHASGAYGVVVKEEAFTGIEADQSKENL